ncbi:hypothetical protein [Peribacillus frigoritolerans]|uniref:Phage minor structural protein GP20 n=1 Tax=Peribacillus castrilensis TaxID=2897690 RepID=A0AAW9NCH6_9BACI|nr:hypothetical protein [Peribacillus castrilensis]
MGLFTKKTNELEVLEAKQGKLQGKAQELQTKISKIQNGLAIAETNLMIDETAANKKQVDKFKVAIGKAQKELEDVGAELSEVASQIGAINEAEKQAKIDEAASVLEEETYLASKRRLMENKVDALKNNLSGSYGYNYNAGMKRLAGVGSTKEFNYSDPSHAPYIEATTKATASGDARANKEFEKLMVEIERFIEMKF